MKKRTRKPLLFRGKLDERHMPLKMADTWRERSKVGWVETLRIGIS